MLGRSLLLASLVVVVVVANGCAASRLKAEDLPPEARAAYVVKPGQSRASVEEVFGIPTAVAPAKHGQVYAQYQFGNAVRSVIYDGRDRVVVAYP